MLDTDTTTTLALSPEDAAWDRLRLAIETYLAEPSPEHLATRIVAAREFVAVCGE